MSTHKFGKQWHSTQLGKVDEEIAKLSNVCGIPLLDPGVVERVIKGDESVCSRPNASSFIQLRKLIAMHYSLTAESIQAIGAGETAQILADLRERLAERFKLGGGPK